MKLVVIIGAGAVGKMTVGQELAKITSLRLCHGHMIIEPILEIFGEFHVAALEAVRKAIFTEFAKSDNYGMITTILMNFDAHNNWEFLAQGVEIFKEAGADIYYAELVADYDTRLDRNKTENRLHNKASKRDLEFSKGRLKLEETFRLVSRDGEIPFENYIKIDNTDLEPHIVAQMIKERFLL